MAVVSREPIIRTLTGLQIGLSFATSQTHGHEFRTLGVKYLGSAGCWRQVLQYSVCVDGETGRVGGNRGSVGKMVFHTYTQDDGPLDEGTLLICIHNECFGSEIECFTAALAAQFISGGRQGR